VKRLTDEQLLALLDDIESDRVERKKKFNKDTEEKVRQAICAFANNLAGHTEPGIVIIGADDGGALVDLNVDDQLLRTLADIRSDGNILPFPSMSVEKRSLHGKSIAVITVMPADAPPVKYKGCVWIRTGSRRGIATAQDERLLNEKRRHHLYLPFDLHPLSFATLNDLSRSTFEEEYLPGAFSADVLEANQRSYEERLSACRMIESVASPVPTVLGAMVIGQSPRDLIACNYVQFLRFAGGQLDAPIMDEAVIDGRVSEILMRLDDKLKAHIATRLDLTSGDVERRTVDYPLHALQQLVRNAIMHRTYESTNAPVRISWFNDRIEILSPGGACGLVNRDNFGEPGMTDYRNPHLAEAMKVLGYVQRFGVGIATARKLLAENGNPPPEFEVTDTHVLATVRRHV